MFAASRYQENVVYDNAPDTFPNVSHVDYNSDYDKYNRLLREIQISLYLGSEHTVLGTVIKQMKIKNKQANTNACFDEDIALRRKCFPKVPVARPKPKYKWDENDEPIFNWIPKRAQERYKDWKYHFHKAYLKEGPSGIPSDFIGREDQWEFLYKHFKSDAFKRLSLANKRNREEKTMHHHTGSSPIIYTMEELRIQREQLPIIKGFEKTYVRTGDEVTTKKYVSVFLFTIK
ncbi:hypothetical protein ACLB2K_030117 [Fragaria x ananassa]